MSCIGIIGAVSTHMDADHLTLIFSEQAEFKNNALRIFEQTRRHYQFMKKALPPVFQDMRKVVPLQAADLVAYEMQKEYERRLYRPDTKPRYGYCELTRPWIEKGFDGIPFLFQTKENIISKKRLK